MATKRKGLSKKTRFEVFKRDKFTCQYCGVRAPEAILACDHILPVASGGKDTLLNLITACQPCNSGKGARHLSDETAVSKQVTQLAALQERREQLDMLMQWQGGLEDLDRDAVEKLATLWAELMPGWAVSDHGKIHLRKIIKRSGVSDTAEAMRKAAASYLKIDTDGKATKESWNLAWSKLSTIAAFNKADEEKPHMRDLFYVRAIVRNRLNGYRDWEALRLLENAYDHGVSVEQLKSIAKSAPSWFDWLSDTEQARDRAMGGP